MYIYGKEVIYVIQLDKEVIGCCVYDVKSAVTFVTKFCRDTVVIRRLYVIVYRCLKEYID